ncbi:MAG: chloride channel protein [Deltaproteobacteria bacterium]|nr:chloride channel protein [Deltaproteobacteria bacterium]
MIPPPKDAGGPANPERGVAASSSTEGLPVAPSMGVALEFLVTPQMPTTVSARVVFLSAVAILIGLGAAVIAQILLGLIGLITNLCFYGRLTTQFLSPAENHLGTLVIIVPALGGVIVGLMARYGSEAIRGHGIPEVMEQILRNQSRIRPRLTFLKPISAAIAIGTGGPFGAEGPIIATGGALGSLIGQLLKTTGDERKILLSAGAAAGMAATFGSPVSAILLAIELLLFEFRPRSLIPVAFACAAATALRLKFMGPTPIFEMPNVDVPTQTGLLLYVVIGALVGIASVGVTRAVYLAEDGFDALPIHWMWWPALGGLFVGIVGYFAPRTLGVGYYNVRDELSGTLAGQALVLLCVLKFISWAISLSSGTSGGTLAPLFTIGGAMGAVMGLATAALFPTVGVDVRVAALIGMAAMFAGASRALLASIVFAFETTLQPLAVLPLAAGCAPAFLLSALLMKHTIMTEKIARRGIRVPVDYEADFLEQISVGEVASSRVLSLQANQTLGEIRDWIARRGQGSTHHGFPVLDGQRLVGMIGQSDLLDSTQPDRKRVGDLIHGRFAIAFKDNTLRQAIDLMAREGMGRVPVVERGDPSKLVGILSDSDVRSAIRTWLEESEQAQQTLRWRALL